MLKHIGYRLVLRKSANFHNRSWYWGRKQHNKWYKICIWKYYFGLHFYRTSYEFVWTFGYPLITQTWTGCCVEPKISHFANFTPCEELVTKRHFWQCEICVWSISTILGSKIYAQISHLYFNVWRIGTYSSDLWRNGSISLRCAELVLNFHKCEESHPIPHMWRIDTQFSKMWKIGTKSSHLQKVVPNAHTCEELVPNYHRREWVVINLHRCQWQFL